MQGESDSGLDSRAVDLYVQSLIEMYTRCIIMCMRTNIVLDDELVREARRYSKARTKRALVDEALRTLVRVRAEEQRRATYRDRLRALQHKLAGLDLRESPAEILRRDRETR
jgi:Arc/MetJ family transcription regulator